MNIFILRKSQSYVPEAYAYKKFLEKYHHKVFISNNVNEIKNNFDLLIMFMGFYPFKLNSNMKYIHEYNSLSLQPYPHFKNFIKSSLNFKPHKRIFLNNYVKFFFNFSDKIDSICRDMGFDYRYKNFSNNNLKKIEYDIVYSGSFEHRIGLFECIEKLSKLNFKIALIGNMNNQIYNKFKNLNNITFFGQLGADQIIEIFNVSKCGLNFTPNTFPFNVQTSTKTIEYSAAKLGVISNRYIWVETFEKSRNANFLYLDNLQSKEQIYNYNFKNAFIDDLYWDNILKQSNFLEFIER